MYIVSTSHRSRQKLKQIIGESSGFYAIKNRGFTGEDIYECTNDQLPEVLKIKGIRKFNPNGKELFKKWDLNY